MKKSLLLTVLILSTVVGYSQTEKGKKMIGGQFNFSGYNITNQDSLFNGRSSSTGFQLYPRVGYFIKDNFAVGVILNFGFSNINRRTNNPSYNYNEKSKSISYGAGGFARYYKKIGDKFSFFGNGSLLYTHTNTRTDRIATTSPTVHSEIPSNGISLDISPGLVYFPSPKIGIEVSFGRLYYNYSVSKRVELYENYERISSYGINLSPSSLSLGMNYYF